jgi:hypothetical protein
MEFYFSGVASDVEFNMLKAAGVSRVLVDPADLPNVDGWTGQVALDCGAYRAWKGGKTFSFHDYMRIAEHWRRFTFITSYEQIEGSPLQNYRHWRHMLACGVRAMPVWQWNTKTVPLLRRYLDEAPRVGIGGMVKILRAKGDAADQTKELERQRAVAFDQLSELCGRYPRRFHLFGANWLHALEALKDTLASADSSKWLDGRRYRMLIFEHTRTGHLHAAPSRAMKCGEWDGDRLSIENARNLERFLAA